MSVWRRADHGDTPEPESIIQAVVYPADTEASVIVYAKFRVAAVLHGTHGVTVNGANMACDETFELPGRPKDIVGRRGFFWRPYVNE